MEYKIAQANLQHSESATHAFLQELVDQNYDMALIQEPYTAKTGTLRAPYFPGSIFQDSNSSPSQPTKSAIIISNRMSTKYGFIFLTEHSNSTRVFVQTGVGHRKIVFGSLYCPPPSEIADDITCLRSLLKSDNIEVIVGMDANAKNVWWGSKKNDKRGETLLDAICEMDLTIMNEGTEPTFQTYRNDKEFKSNIDITLAAETLVGKITGWRINKYLAALSDHNAIEFLFNLEETRETIPPNTTYLYKSKKANWTTFQNSLRREVTNLNLSPERARLANTGDEVESLALSWTTAISQACRDSMPTIANTCGVKARPCPWWNDELTHLKKLANKAKHKMQNSAPERRENETLPIYLKARAKLKEEIKKAKIASWKKFCTAQNIDSVWNTINKILKRRAKAPPSTLMIGGIHTRDAKETADSLMRAFFPEDSPTTDTDIQESIRNSSSLHQTPTKTRYDDPPFTSHEVLTALQDINPNGAPGQDHLTPDICVRAARTFPELVTEIYNAALRCAHFPSPWKTAVIKAIIKPGKDANQVTSYRPIGLLPIFGKGLEKVAINRAMWAMRTKLSALQYGFTKQRGTSDALTDAVSHIQQHVSLKRIVAVISLDIKGAFDNAWWPLIIHQLKEKGCPDNIVNLFKNYFENRETQLHYSGATTVKKPTRGCIQGSVCGPAMWNLIVDDLLNTKFDTSVRIQAFADDILLMVDAPSVPELESMTNATLKTVCKWGLKAKLNFSQEKTQTIVVTKKRKLKSPTLIMDGKPLLIGRTIKVLGVVIDDKLSWHSHVDYACAKTAKMAKTITKIAREGWGLSPEVINILYRGAVEPMLAYAAPVWSQATNKRTVIRKLTAAQRPFLLKCTRAYRTTANTAISAIAGISPLDLRVKQISQVYAVKKTHKLRGHLPSDRRLEAQIAVADLPHPALRLPAKVTIEGSRTSPPKAPPTSDINLYTDGSKTDNGVGAAFFAVAANGTVLKRKKLRLENYCSIYQAEQLAIAEALQWAAKSNLTQIHIHIISDSQSALRALQNSQSTNPIVQRTFSHIADLKEKMIEVEFSWTPGHMENTGNEEADRLAKEAAETGNMQKAYSRFPLCYAKAILREELLHNWNTRYIESPSGSETKKFLPTIPLAIAFRNRNSPSPNVTQALTGHGPFNDYLHRFRIINDPTCQCDNHTHQNTNHLLWECPMLEKERYAFIQACRSQNIKEQDYLAVLGKPELEEHFLKYLSIAVQKCKDMRQSHYSN